MNKFIYAESVIKALEIAFKTNKNIILYGPGGYGKSEMSESFLREKGITPFVLTMGKGMTVDKLFGGVDIKKLTEEGSIEYLVENSFMNHEYVILEELFDCKEVVLEQLKDVLSSRQLRNGSQVFKLKTKLIISNTNRTKSEFASEDRSLLALMERFPLQKEVVWPYHNESDYNELFRSARGKESKALSKMLSLFDKNKVTISPRIALDAFDVFSKTKDIEDLLLIDKIEPHKALFYKFMFSIAEEMEAESHIDKIYETIEEIRKDLLEDDISKLIMKITEIQGLISEKTNKSLIVNQVKIDGKINNSLHELCDEIEKKLREDV